jgi:glycosyltransferase involved in cell wall biosynthesis
VIPNWADGQVIRPLVAGENRFRREHDLQGRFVVMYSGNLGVGHDIETPLRAARRLAATHPKVLFLFVGDGARRHEAEALSRSATNVRFLPYQPRERLSESLSAADAHLVTLVPGAEGLVVPSKLYGALAAGRPILYVGPAACEVSCVVREGEVGWSGAGGDGDALARAIATLADNPTLAAALGHRARQLLEDKYDRRHAVRRWRELLHEAAGKRSDVNAP